MISAKELPRSVGGVDEFTQSCKEIPLSVQGIVGGIVIYVCT